VELEEAAQNARNAAAAAATDFDYCRDAAANGLPPCEGDGTLGAMTREQELAALQIVCYAREDCIGIHQQPDASLRLCRGPYLDVSYPEGELVTGRGQLLLNPTPKRWAKSFGTCDVIDLGHEKRGYACFDNSNYCENLDVYCKNAEQLALPLCMNTPGYSAGDELKAAQAICAARDDCAGVWDKNDDGVDLFLCSHHAGGFEPDASQAHNVYRKPQTSLPWENVASSWGGAHNNPYNSFPGLTREQTQRWLP